MPVCRALLLLVLCGSLGAGAELRTLAGKTVSGELVGINAKEIVFKTSDGEVATPVAQVLDVELQQPGKPANDPHSRVELTDGSVLLCGKVTIQGKDVTLALLAGGQEVKVPLRNIAHVMTDAQKEDVRKEWQQRFLGKRRTRDVIVVLREDTLNPLEGTIGDADDKGEKIDFELASGRKVEFPLANAKGLIFQRGPDPNAKEIVCKFHDTQGNQMMVAEAGVSDKGFALTLSCGVKVEYARALAARLDYSKDKVVYLSRVEPAREPVQTSTEDRVEVFPKAFPAPGRDRNLDGGPLRLAGTTYAAGLALHSYTELEYDLKGEYREFKAVVGVDDQVGSGSDGYTVLRIEGDNGQELKTVKVSRKDKPQPIVVDVRNVQRLKIVVKSDDLLDLGKHLNLADARVSK